MSLQLSAVEFSSTDQPDLARLQSYGWRPCLSATGTVMPDTLLYDVGRVRFILVREQFNLALFGRRAKSSTFTRLYIHAVQPDHEFSLLRGHGESLTLAEVMEALNLVMMMIEDARS